MPVMYPRVVYRKECVMPVFVEYVLEIKLAVLGRVGAGHENAAVSEDRMLNGNVPVIL
jgi:hypothetical protein